MGMLAAITLRNVPLTHKRKVNGCIALKGKSIGVTYKSVQIFLWASMVYYYLGELFTVGSQSKAIYKEQHHKVEWQGVYG